MQHSCGHSCGVVDCCQDFVPPPRCIGCRIESQGGRFRAAVVQAVGVELGFAPLVGLLNRKVLAELIRYRLLREASEEMARYAALYGSPDRGLDNAYAYLKAIDRTDWWIGAGERDRVNENGAAMLWAAANTIAQKGSSAGAGGRRR